MKSNWRNTFFLAIFTVLPCALYAQNHGMSFEQYVAQLKVTALNKGFSKSVVNQSFSDVTYHQRAVVADKSQPEKIETLDTYLPKRLPQWKVEKARALYKEHYAMLRQVGETYHVQPRFIVALWGVESNFGKVMGNYNVISALTTLAYDGRREDFFLKELWAALTILEQGHISYEQMKGSWAGAMGQSQFMPSSFLQYSVDGDGDGKKDIWTNHHDVFASIANYLQQEGWDNNGTWGRQVKLPTTIDLSLAIKKNTGSKANWLFAWQQSEKSLSDWQSLGVRRADGRNLPSTNITAALVLPDGEKGRAYLIYHNYKTLMHWNFSYYFVSSVGHLSDQIKYPKIDLSQ